MTKGKFIAMLLTSLILISLLVISVKADFSYDERYDSYTRQYDTWVYDVDIDDEDTRIIVRHVWSSPRYGYDYDTESDNEFEYGPTRSRDRRIVQLNRPPYSNDVGQELVRAFTRRGYYSGYGYSGYGGWGGYYRNYW